MSCKPETTHVAASVLMRTHEWLASIEATAGQSVLMPIRPAEKSPLFRHRDGTWTQRESESFLRSNQAHPEWGILLDRMCVVDADDDAAVAAIEGLADAPMAPEELVAAIRRCPCQRTRKGRHYFFLRPDWADAEGFWDGARQASGGLAIDFKSRCSTGTRGVIVVEPSTNKEWIDGRAPWDDGIVLVDIPRKLANIVASPRETRADAASCAAPQTVTMVKGPAVAPDASNNLGTSHASNTPDAAMARQLVELLSDGRADIEPEWMRVGWCLHNIDVGLLDVWDRFSRRSPKHVEGECARRWAAMSTTANPGSRLRLGSLHHWARRDSPAAYADVVRARVCTLGLCNGTHNDIARVGASVFSGRFVYSDSKMWYVFEGGRWRADPTGARLRLELTSTLRDYFVAAMNRIAQNAALDDLPSASDAGRSSSESSRASEPGRATTSERNEVATLLRITRGLQDTYFKKCVVTELADMLLDEGFEARLDADPGLLGFDDGVWDLREGAFREATPDDMVSMSVGYAYRCNETSDAEADRDVQRYWETLHPDAEQREYVLRMFARQLFGDSGLELFHVHSGHNATAANGKSKFFEVLELALGPYVRMFGVEMLTAKARPDAGRPMPELAKWRGVRVLYCTEPNHGDTINSGILKQLTGGEKVSYRNLFSNKVERFTPQYKMHMMCNDKPKVDGSDSGVERRTRVVEYISRFVDAERADASEHMYPRDPALLEAFKAPVHRLAFVRRLLSVYRHDWQFEMPEAVRASSREYLDDNDPVKGFIDAHIVASPGGWFTLSEARKQLAGYAVTNSGGPGAGAGTTVATLKTALCRGLGTQCHAQKWLGGGNRRNAFVGFALRHAVPEAEGV